MSPTHQDLSNDTTFSQIKSRVPVPLNTGNKSIFANISLYNLDQIIKKCLGGEVNLGLGLIDLFKKTSL